MDKLLGIKREHGELTYQGALTVAAPATVNGEFASRTTTRRASVLGRSDADDEPEPVYLPRVDNNSKSSGEMTLEIPMNTQANTTSAAVTKISALANISELATARLAAIAFAGAMLFTVGFAQSATVHNAAHDTRHVQVFPCH